jgi:hypothetical protein
MTCGEKIKRNRNLAGTNGQNRRILPAHKARQQLSGQYLPQKRSDQKARKVTVVKVSLMPGMICTR